MNDLISRQALKNTLTDWQMEYAENGKDVERFETLGQVLDLVEQFPTIEPKRGKWIKMSDRDGVYLACSECGEELPRISHYNPQFDLFPRLESIENTNYCPNCGAKMERSEE